MSERQPEGPIPGASQRINDIMRHWEAEKDLLSSWFTERRIQPDSKLFLKDLLHYVIALFDNTAAHNRLIWVEQYSDIDSEYIPSLRHSSEEHFKIAEAYAKHRLEGVELEAFLLAVRTRLDSRITYWRGEALHGLELPESVGPTGPVPEMPRDADVEKTEVTLAANGAAQIAAYRQKAVDAYIEEVLAATGKRITRTNIWQAAGYKTRTEFERWQRNDQRATKRADKRFTKLLFEKPHLKRTSK